jgi:hypothetical protein
MGIDAGQTDPGYWVVKKLQAAGFVWDVGLPRILQERDDLDVLPVQLTESQAHRGGN